MARDRDVWDRETLIVSAFQAAVGLSIGAAQEELRVSGRMVERLHEAVRDGYLNAYDRLLNLGIPREHIDAVLVRNDMSLDFILRQGGRFPG
ncbi:hypothetical protein HNQ07_000917 [Deinococcus metalli]|uniref:Uncharacterized protein n=1 Tax=Deinococcus metalli TaxID=1141878 RepID=A0A7W8KE89_9DEIO|nr:hypothetical protein [Deinococcus metalli]MBB5375473.1 hypothetical protein [Deinococcus metalli]GHF29019.1 hypothetical protein GCM10017781_01230 [Deinococcus metalli]